MWGVSAYLLHVVFVLIGLGILRATRTSKPRLALFPTRKHLGWFAWVAGALVTFTIVWDAILFPGGNGSTTLSRTLELGWTYAASYIFFETVFVGWTEEYLFRGALQRVFDKILGKKAVRGLTYSAIITAVLFGGLHLMNLTYQPLGETIEQSVFAFLFALILGLYYDRTEDLAGAAWIHNIQDAVSAVIIPLLQRM